MVIEEKPQEEFDFRLLKEEKDSSLNVCLHSVPYFSDIYVSDN